MSERLEKASDGPRRPAAGAPRLNSLERQILSLLVEGTTNADIAGAVHLSQSTVKFHVRQILQRVGATNRTHARTLPFANINSVRRNFHTLAAQALEMKPRSSR